MTSQRWGRMGRMEGGYSSPSIMWMIPLDATMLVLASRTPFPPNRTSPWRGMRVATVSGNYWLFNVNYCESVRNQSETLTSSDTVMATIWFAVVWIWGRTANSSSVSCRRKNIINKLNAFFGNFGFIKHHVGGRKQQPDSLGTVSAGEKVMVSLKLKGPSSGTGSGCCCMNQRQTFPSSQSRKDKDRKKNRNKEMIERWADECVVGRLLTTAWEKMWCLRSSWSLCLAWKKSSEY